MLLENLKNYEIILASGSPRRQELLTKIGLSFKTLLLKDIDESYPPTLAADDVSSYISRKKAKAYVPCLTDNQLIITSDTTVVCASKVLGKPKNREDAYNMLCYLSGKTHHVVTGVTILSKEKQKTFSVRTDVSFNELTDGEINYYIDHYKPFDKAGAYGIQEWIGLIAVKSISGSYFNVMGLPVQRLYQELKNW